MSKQFPIKLALFFVVWVSSQLTQADELELPFSADFDRTIDVKGLPNYIDLCAKHVGLVKVSEPSTYTYLYKFRYLLTNYELSSQVKLTGTITDLKILWSNIQLKSVSTGFVASVSSYFDPIAVGINQLNWNNTVIYLCVDNNGVYHPPSGPIVQKPYE